MSSPSWIHKGQRVKKYKARDSRWGKGKVHVAVHAPRHRAYGMGCKQLSDLDFILGGVDAGNVPRSRPVTCKKCLKKFPDVDGGKKVATAHQKNVSAERQKTRSPKVKRRVVRVRRKKNL